MSIRTAFDDMPSDLDFGPAVAAAPLAETAKQRFVAAPASYTEPCLKCRGSGKFRTFTGYTHGACFACGGTGKRVFKTSPEARAKATAGAHQRKVNAELERAAEAQAKANAWKAEHEAANAWLRANANRSEFAASLNAALHQYGTLTPNQLAAVERAIERDAAHAAAKAAAPVLRLDRLHAVMQRHAKFYAGKLTLARKNGDQLVWIKHADAERVIGKLDNGVLTLWNRPGVDMEYVGDMLAEFEHDPLAAAKRFGKLAGRCCSCGRDLTNDGSIEEGIGPICATKFE
jgi:hypothetical protein